MPEGPEVKRQADRIRRGVAGARAKSVHFGLERLEAYADELSGRQVEGVDSRGKALLVHFEGGLSVYAHNQLYGRWYVVRPDRPPRTRRQLRFAIQTEATWALLYSASDIDVLERSRLAEHPFLGRLGPDVLDLDVRPDDIVARLDEPRFRGRSLAALLLDQSFVAGLGNYLRSEVLFFAGLRPEHRPKALSSSERARLAEEILDVARRSYRTGGLTLEDELAAQLKAEGLSKRQRRHHVFGRSGAVCRRCDTPIEKGAMAGRRIYICPGCQI